MDRQSNDRCACLTVRPRRFGRRRIACKGATRGRHHKSTMPSRKTPRSLPGKSSRRGRSEGGQRVKPNRHRTFAGVGAVNRLPPVTPRDGDGAVFLCGLAASSRRTRVWSIGSPINRARSAAQRDPHFPGSGRPATINEEGPEAFPQHPGRKLREGLERTPAGTTALNGTDAKRKNNRAPQRVPGCRSCHAACSCDSLGRASGSPSTLAQVIRSRRAFRLTPVWPCFSPRW
jgi:hypothetical protein